MSAEQVAALADRLEAIAEELADVAIEQLKGSLRRRPTTRAAGGSGDGGSGDGKRDDDAFGGALPVIDERRVTRARRAVEKAVALLRAADTATDDD